MKRPFEELVRFSVINVDKPSGMLSSQVDKKVESLLGIKAAHAGTLDPKVTGVLIIALGEAVKALHLLSKTDKTYEGIIHLHRDVPIEEIKKAIEDKFIGEIIQIPPLKSRVSRKPRKRVVHSFDILKKEGKNVFFSANVQAGTYIRKIVHDLGKEIGCGAHMKYLRRIKSGQFEIKDSIPLEMLERIADDREKLEKILIPIEDAIQIKKIGVSQTLAEKIMKGSPLRLNSTKELNISVGEEVALLYSGKILALGTFNGKSIKVDRVFINKSPNNG